MRRFILPAVAVFALGCGAGSNSNETGSPDNGGTAVFAPIPLPDFTLTERSGKSVSLADLKGKVWVASFVFTHCTSTCPKISATVARLQSELAPTRPDLRFVTFSVDPARDTPAVLAKYADQFGAKPGTWLFLTGKEGEVHKLLNEGFLVNTERNKDGKPGDEFMHSPKLVVVDKAGRICGLFDGVQSEYDESGEQYEAGLKRLAAKVDELLKQ
ncbi:MAG TPA: SCO family protein [Fimbriiglobus sp.]|jgi:cytochrome oxidase Cu insertion factor (SCO1/SenC/PrrC family)